VASSRSMYIVTLMPMYDNIINYNNQTILKKFEHQFSLPQQIRHTQVQFNTHNSFFHILFAFSLSLRLVLPQEIQLYHHCTAPVPHFLLLFYCPKLYSSVTHFTSHTPPLLLFSALECRGIIYRGVPIGKKALSSRSIIYTVI
jgi:hypothetical protein